MRASLYAEIVPKLTQKEKGFKLFKSRVKSIRSFVDFDYDLRKAPTKAQKAKVKRYSDEIAKLRNRPYQVYRPRIKSRLRPVQQFAQQDTSLPGIKVAFVPTAGKRQKIRFNKRGITAVAEHVRITSVTLSIRGLAGDTGGYVARRIADIEASHFTIQAGAFEIPIPYLPESVPVAVTALVERYGGNGEVPDKEERENHHWANWLFGLKSYTAENQEDVTAYLMDKREQIKNDKKERDRARKRKERRAQQESKGR